MRIVYGGPGAAEMGRTFGDALEQVCDGGHVRIVSPYISPDKLTDVLRRSARVSVITDLLACFSVLSVSDRAKMTTLICDHISAVRHLPGVHAKVVFSQSRFLLGSANLTSKGFESRDELGVLFHEATQLAEAREWFEALWNRGRPLYAEDVLAWVTELKEPLVVTMPPFAPIPPQAARKPTAAPHESSRRVRAEVDAVLSRVPDTADLRAYLGLIRWAYTELGVPTDDPRIVVSVSRNYIHLSINNRWVLQPGDDPGLWGFLLELPFAEKIARRGRGIIAYQYSSARRNEEPPCIFAVRGLKLLDDPQVRSAFLRAMQAELRKGRSGSNRRYHRADLLDLILDERALHQRLDSLGIA